MCIGRNNENDKFEVDVICALVEIMKMTSLKSIICFQKIANKKKFYQVLQFTINSLLMVTLKEFGQKLGALLTITNYLNSRQKKAYFQWNDKLSIQLLFS